MYLFYIYVARDNVPDQNDPIYAKVLCTYTDVAKYVDYLNKRSTDYRYYYFIRVSAYIDTDTVKVESKTFQSNYITDIITNGGY